MVYAHLVDPFFFVCYLCGSRYLDSQFGRITFEQDIEQMPTKYRDEVRDLIL